MVFSMTVWLRVLILQFAFLVQITVGLSFPGVEELGESKDCHFWNIIMH